MLTLISKPQTRSASIIWLLEEIGASYETRVVTTRTADGKGARDPNNPHPHGKVPALLHDGALVFESAAIALYLVDLFPEAGLGPRVGEPKRGALLSWLAYRPGVLEPAMLERHLKIEHVTGAMGWPEPDEVDALLNRHLAENRYFLGDKFSAADIMVGGAIQFMIMVKRMAETLVFKEYVERITARPAFQRAMAK
ncbi:glutathione S-transferase family protein [Dongia sp.]|uniref:glutathione S-transferase family protein n=1 Tax=Dongia sp. TaxID=1977262 RepID=UPI0037537DE7